MLQDPFFWAFIVTALILGWVVSGAHGVARGLHQTIEQLALERDAQARTIQWQRRVIAELEHKITLKGINTVVDELNNEQTEKMIDDVIKEIQDL